MTRMPKFDPFPAATSGSIQFERALDAWEWLDENGFDETDPGCFRKNSWTAELQREPKDRGDRPVVLTLHKRR